VEVPASLERVLKTALEKEPNKRYPDAKTFREALENLRFDGDHTQAGSRRAALKKPAVSSARLRAIALGLGLGVAAVGVLAGVYRFRPRPAALPQASPPPVAGKPPAGDWRTPYAVPGLTLALDQTFDSDKLRVQSAAARDLAVVRERAQEALKLLTEYLEKSEPGRAAVPAVQRRLPLTISIVPQAILNRADLWPGFEIKPDKTYPSRYVEPRRTLFVADTKGFERRDLAYGIALHVLVPEKSLSTDLCLDLAEGFEAYYQSHAVP
jgi:hypothetical protein